LRDLRRDHPRVERVARNVLRPGDAHAPGIQRDDLDVVPMWPLRSVAICPGVTSGLSPAAKVLNLKGRFRCRGCGRKGRAVVSIKWRVQGV
jgi:hypothetical protein